MPLPTSVLGLMAVAALGAAGDVTAPARGRVSAAALDVLDGPGDAAFTVGRLARGTTVVVRAVSGDWLAIAPPAGAFCWIDARALQDEGAGRALVLVDGAVVRSGIVGARLPGPPRLALRRGTRVELLDRPPLTIGQGDAARTWRAIAPPRGLDLYVRAEGVLRAADSSQFTMAAQTARVPAATRSTSIPEPGAPSRRVRLASVDSGLNSVAPDEARTAALPPGLDASLKAIESEHRSALSPALESWNLQNVRRRYEALLAATSDPAAQALLRRRIAHVDRQQSAADAARRLRDLLTRSRSRDLELDATLSDPALPATGRPTATFYNSTGMLQRSSRLIDGQRVYVVIGPDGRADAYLKIPPGLNAERLVSRQVGARGAVGYNDDLRAKVVSVLELDALD